MCIRDSPTPGQGEVDAEGLVVAGSEEDAALGLIAILPEQEGLVQLPSLIPQQTALERGGGKDGFVGPVWDDLQALPKAAARALIPGEPDEIAHHIIGQLHLDEVGRDMVDFMPGVPSGKV